MNLNSTVFYADLKSHFGETLFAWKLQANGSVHNMQRCFKILWGYFSSPRTSAPLPWGKIA